MRTLLMIGGAVLGAFLGFWTAFGLFFAYSKPLGVWAHPFVWAVGGAILGPIVAAALLRPRGR